MSLVRFKPYSPAATFNSVLENFFGDDASNLFNRDYSATLPAVNVQEHAEAFTVEVAAPGLKKENFKINVNHELLTISSQFEDTKEEKEEGKYTRREFNYSAFQRSFTLPKSVDGEKIQAKYEDGVLRISLPKREEAKVKPNREIQIS
ncbi:HSP20 family protein [Catalinimonas alkaloidigena]|uniref:HSP20 family protein n=1 Tax=Catalinimonas alkaloidigena TaxID=1075417 RepID=A0A1G9SI12_9BACT|nr:Hsp20/alpha crystallin family protein [Catalinimonas alkaloidigena]SDM34950.1 HSP20 family protein [Catalinimonas alkaloidigena]